MNMAMVIVVRVIVKVVVMMVVIVMKMQTIKSLRKTLDQYAVSGFVVYNPKPPQYG